MSRGGAGGEARPRRRRRRGVCRHGLLLGHLALAAALAFAGPALALSEGAPPRAPCRPPPAAGAVGRRAYGRVEASQAAYGATYSSGTSPDDLMQALGRELWVVGQQLFRTSVAATGGNDPVGTPLGRGGLVLQNAASLMMDGRWEEVMAEMEVFQATVRPYTQRCQGLVDLFAYDEPVPVCEWSNSRKCLIAMAEDLGSAATDLRLDRSVHNGPEAANALFGVKAALEKAAGLFSPRTFYMPAEDPRPGRSGTSDEAQPDRAQASRDQALDELRKSGQSSGLMGEVDKALEEAGTSAREKNKVLRKLMKDLHPDRNGDRVAEVTPVFQYVQRLRAEMRD